MIFIVFRSPKTPNLLKTLKPFFSFFSSLPNHSNHNQTLNPLEIKSYQIEQESSKFSVTNNREYWSRQIHSLCTSYINGVDEALRILDTLLRRGYRMDSLNLSSIFHSFCKSKRFSEARNFIVKSVPSECVPDERTCNVLIACMLNSLNVKFTLDVIRCFISSKPEFVPSLMNYNRLIDQFCVILRPREAHKLLLDVRGKGHCPNVVSYTTLINGYCKIGELGFALKVYDEMFEKGVKPNSFTYSILTRGFFREKDIVHGREMMGNLWWLMADENDPSVNIAAFVNLVDSLCQEGLFDDIFKIAEDTPQGTSVETKFAYGILIDSLCRIGRSNAASRIFYIMRKKGYTPSLASYNHIVHEVCQDGNCMRAYQLLEEGLEFGYFPSEYTYKILVNCLFEEENTGHQKAKEVLQIMLKKVGNDAKTRIHNIYLKALCKLKNPTELLNVLALMIETKCKPDVITLNILTNGLCEMGEVDDGLKVLNDMMLGQFCYPDTVTFTTIISGLMNVGRYKEALEVLNRVMPDKGVNPNVVTYNSVLLGLFRNGQANEALAFFDSMLGCGIIANCTTYAIIIDGLCEFKRIDEAKAFWNNVIWPSKIHDNFVYAALLKGLCRSHKFHEAWDFLYELVDCGVRPNIVNYNILIDKACKLGLKKEAYKIVGEMKKNGLVPDSVTWRTLDKLYGKAKLNFCIDESALPCQSSS